MKEIPSKVCAECGNTFYKSITRSMKHWNTKAKYCSRICSSKHTLLDGTKQPTLQQRAKGEKNHKWKGGQVTLSCKHCSRVFQVDKYRANAKTCSIACNKEYRKTEEFRLNQSESLRAIQPREKTFARSFTSLLRTCSRYAQWREKVLERDDYTCQICTKRGGKLQVDHIKPFVSILLENEVSDYESALWCKELWEVENGRTLCLPCHYKTDTFGSKALKKLLTN